MRPRRKTQRATSRTLTNLAAIATCFAVTVASGAARAYRTQDEARWETPISIGVAGETPAGLTDADVIAAIQSAIWRWMEPSCTAVTYRFRGRESLPAEEGDGRTTIEFVRSGWAARGFEEDAAATAVVVYAADFRSIVDADVYVNAETYRWTLSTSMGATRNLESAIVHELGHVFGLLHPCDEGRRCEFLPTVMDPLFDDADPTLRADDIAAICTLYPAETCEDCSDPDPPGCSVEYCGTLGDPCEAMSACDSGVCLGEFCSASCEERPCPRGWHCSADFYCYIDDNRAPFGGDCSEGAECASGVCVLIGGVGACSRSCDSSCPSEHMCEELVEGSFCTPEAASMAEGCATVDARSGIAPSLLLLIAAMLWRNKRGAGGIL